MLAPVLPLLGIVAATYASRQIRTVSLLGVSGIGLAGVPLWFESGGGSLLRVGPQADPTLPLWQAALLGALAVLGLASGPLLVAAALLIYRRAT